MATERTKNGLSHDVPLSTQAKALLSAVQRRASWVLLFGDGNGPLSGWSQSKRRLDVRIARRGAEARLGRSLAKGESPEPADALAPSTLHDLRRSLVASMNELGIAPRMVEAVVNHASGQAKAGVAGVYNRAVHAAEKRMALQAWADLIDMALADAGIMRTPSNLLIETLRFCAASGQLPARIVAVAPAQPIATRPRHAHDPEPASRPAGGTQHRPA